MNEVQHRAEGQMVHISSAVLQIAAEQVAAVEAEIGLLDGCEVAVSENGKMIVLIEGPTSGVVGEKLTQMALLDGVHSACMVYEQAETVQSLGENA